MKRGENLVFRFDLHSPIHDFTERFKMNLSEELNELIFSYHKENCRNKTLNMLGLVKRNNKDFKNIEVIKLFPPL